MHALGLPRAWTPTVTSCRPPRRTPWPSSISSFAIVLSPVADSQYRLRRAVPADAGRLAWVHIRSWQQAYAGQLPSDYLERLTDQLQERTERWQRWLRTNQPWVAETADEGIVGFAFWGHSLDDGETAATAQLWAIYLLAEHWGEGIGRRLMQAAISSMREAGHRETTLWVLESNSRARRFYEAGGWVTDGATQVDDREGLALREVRYRLRLA